MTNDERYSIMIRAITTNEKALDAMNTLLRVEDSNKTPIEIVEIVYTVFFGNND